MKICHTETSGKNLDIIVPRKTTLHVKRKVKPIFISGMKLLMVFIQIQPLASWDDKGRPYKLSISSSISWKH